MQVAGVHFPGREVLIAAKSLMFVLGLEAVSTRCQTKNPVLPAGLDRRARPYRGACERGRDDSAAGARAGLSSSAYSRRAAGGATAGRRAGAPINGAAHPTGSTEPTTEVQMRNSVPHRGRTVRQDHHPRLRPARRGVAENP